MTWSGELYEYVDRHWEAKAAGDFPVVVMTDADGNEDVRFHELAAAYSDSLRELAFVFVGKLSKMTGEVVIEQMGGIQT